MLSNSTIHNAPLSSGYQISEKFTRPNIVSHTKNEDLKNIDVVYGLKELLNSFDVIDAAQSSLERKLTGLVMDKRSLQKMYGSLLQANLHVLGKKSLGELEHSTVLCGQILSLRAGNFPEESLSVIMALFI
jgi:predicted oxidoreductase